MHSTWRFCGVMGADQDGSGLIRRSSEKFTPNLRVWVYEADVGAGSQW